MHGIFGLVLLLLVAPAYPAYADSPNQEKPLPDSQISQLLQGKWRAEENGSAARILAVQDYRNDGTLVTIGTMTVAGRSVPLALSGVWKVVDGYIVATLEESNIPQIRPGLVTRDYVLSIDGSKLRYRTDSGKVSIRNRLREPGAP
jgi:hypothetical protein